MNESRSIEREIQRQVARFAAIDLAQVEPSSWISAYDIDSLDRLLLRESIERTSNVVVTDDAWLSFSSIADLADHIAAVQRVPDGRHGSVVPGADRPGGVSARATARLGDDAVFHDELEIGMSLTGPSNLSESAFLKYLGDIRWSHMSAISRVPSRAVVDQDGRRLYPAFFYVDLRFPEHAPITSFGECDRLNVRATLGRFGESMLDGVIYLLDPHAEGSRDLVGCDVATAAATGIPAVRLTNVFVRRHGGSEWLKRSLPANPGFDRIPPLAGVPDSYEQVRAAEKAGRFRAPDAGYRALTAAAVTREIPIVPERDLNAAGLVYFANYPLFLDICERAVLLAAGLGLDTASVHRRALVSRQCAYLHNASFDDSVVVETETWVREMPESSRLAGGWALSLLVNQRMWRKSDERLMLVSTSEKLIPDMQPPR